MITLKTVKGKHIVTICGQEWQFRTLSEAWEFIYNIRYVERQLERREG
jgi:hypothetical protein